MDKSKPHICIIFKIIEEQFDSLCLKVTNFNVICLFIESLVQWTCKKEKEMDLGYILEGKSVGLVTDRICGRRKRWRIRIPRIWLNWQKRFIQ